MASSVQWESLSQEVAKIVDEVGGGIVAVHGGRRLSGCGIHWRSGLIVTADHALRHDAQFTVTLPDHTSVSAQLVGGDPSTDVAVVKVEDASKLAKAQTTSGEGLRVGHMVVAVGRSHLGDIAASAGIVARLGAGWRTWRGGQIDQLIRPDVSLYPGQSGSALVNSRGQVLGMNTNALARISAITVPASTIDRVVGELVEHGHIRRPYLGLAMQVVSLPDDVRKKLKLESQTGLLVMHVDDDGPGSKAGVMLGDIIISLQGNAAGDLRSLQETLAGLRIGQQASITIVRGGEKKELTITAGERPTRR